MTDWLNSDDAGDSGSWLSGQDDPPHPSAPDLPVPTAIASEPGSGSWLDDAPAAAPAPYAAPATGAQPGGWLGDDAAVSGGDGYLGMGSDLDELAATPAPSAGAPAPRPTSSHTGMAPAVGHAAPGEYAIDAPYLEEVQPGRRTLSSQPRGTLTDLVLDVPVPVEVSFGDAMLTVEDFLELGPGAVVELDRAIEAPVELRVRGKLIAHGQLVTVNGRYGLRVTRMAEEQS